jgi:RNA methyltransferase, TrmH family
VPVQLSSTRSPRVQALRELHDRAGRRAAKRFLVEGPHAVEQALTHGLVRELWVRDDLAVDASWPVDVVASAAVMNAVAQTQHPQGVVAVCDIPRMDIDQILKRPGPILVLDQLADPGNVGTLIRTAAAVGAAGVILTPGSVDPCNDKVVRSAAGTWFDVPIVEGVADSDIDRLVSGSGRTLIALDAQAPDDLYAMAQAGAIPGDAAWIIGSEAHGIQGAMTPNLVVRIPMVEGVESLNAAVAGALCLYANRHAPPNP